MKDFVYEGFDELVESGYVSDYIEITHYQDGRPSVMRPAFDLECCRGICSPKGTKMRFLYKHGYDGERKRASEIIGDRIVTVREATIARSSSDYEFEEVSGKWNSVMFEEVGE